MSRTRRLAILGGGPVGIEAAALARSSGFDVVLFEKGPIGGHIRQWDHVRFFSPWSMNRSSWGEKILKARGVEMEDPDAFPRGEEYRSLYLDPLVEALRDEIEICEQTQVLGVSRKDSLKGDFVADPRRQAGPFLIRVDGPDGEPYREADLVIDATGVLSQPNFLGPGGLPAPGEEELNGEILRHIPDVEKQEWQELAGGRILVVGHGHSAISSLDILRKLHRLDEKTQIFWVFRDGPASSQEIDDDPLPERARLIRLANAASLGQIDGIEARPHSMIRLLKKTDNGIEVELESSTPTETLCVDRIVSNVGYRPDTSLYRELQIHLCYATEGPMKLAASLLAQSGNVDCLQQDAVGVDLLKNPEPNFFVLGAKSYGRNSNFLLRIGFEQISVIFDALR